jgi:chromate transporter
VLLGRIAIGD